jgi:general secretion pathway protein I
VRRRRESGFTLLEVVIAFTLLAAMLAVVLRLFSQGAYGIGRAERRTIALLHAESKLAELVVTARKPEKLDGKFADGYRWRATLALQRERRLGDPPPLIEPLLVSVTVAAPDDDFARGITLGTVQLLSGERS